MKIHPNLLIILFTVMASAYASPYPHMKDPQFDALLSRIDELGQKHFADYLHIVHQQSKMKKESISEYINNKKLKPADITLALGLAQLTDARPEVILRRYGAHRSMGWSLMANMMGIKKGSKKYQSWQASQESFKQQLQRYIDQKQKLKLKNKTKPPIGPPKKEQPSEATSQKK